MKQPDLVLRCDGTRCLALPKVAPRLFVPGKTSTGQPALRQPAITLAFPHLSYCDKCWGEARLFDILLTDKVKARFEERGRKIWPMGISCDFDAAFLQPISVFSPEYGQYMRRIGLNIDGLGYSLHNNVHRRPFSG